MYNGKKCHLAINRDKLCGACDGVGGKAGAEKTCDTCHGAFPCVRKMNGRMCPYGAGNLKLKPSLKHPFIRPRPVNQTKPNQTGRGVQIQLRQIGPGMVQQIQSACSSCRGAGKTMSEKDKCKVGGCARMLAWCPARRVVCVFVLDED